MSNNFDLRKFLTENKLTSVAKNISEWDDKSVKDYADAMSKAFGNKTKEEEPEKKVNEAAELSPIEQELVDAVMGNVNEAIDLGKILNKVKLLANKGLLTVAMASAILASCGSAGSSDEIFKRELDNLKKVDSIEHVQKTRIDSISNDIKSNPTTATIKESEGYVEVMGEDFDEAVDQIVFAWEQWKNGPATEPEDIEPAREDVVGYIRSLLK